MAGRPLSAAQLQHNRDIAKRGGQATAAKYGGYHFAHLARSSKAKGTYVRPTIKAPFAALRAKYAALPRPRNAPGTKGRTGSGALSPVSAANTFAKSFSIGRSTSLPKTVHSSSRSTKTTRRRKPAVR